jgi:bacteriorhodopsin
MKLSSNFWEWSAYPFCFGIGWQTGNWLRDEAVNSVVVVVCVAAIVGCGAMFIRALKKELDY